MSLREPQKPKRRRGVILTPEALNKLYQAKAEAEFQSKGGERFTLEDLCDRTGLSTDTLIKVFARETGVDKQTLQTCFRAFGLTLTPQDYTRPSWRHANAQETMPDATLEFPEGQVALQSPFYVERPALEATAYLAILQPGALVRIKAPRHLGKSSLLARILHHAEGHNCHTVSLSFQLADTSIFESLDRFLQWFCASVALGLGKPTQLSTYWDDIFGSKISCKHYFAQYLLANLNQPLVLGLDDVDRLFQYPQIAQEFFSLLRAWHEEGKNQAIWQKLRLVVVHAAELYIALNLYQSPFNVGLPLELPPFNAAQIAELAHRHGLNRTMELATQLLTVVGGNPLLVRLALYHMADTGLPLATLSQPDGIYRAHLQRQLWQLQQHPELKAAMAAVVDQSTPVRLDWVQAVKLQGLGLVNLQGYEAMPSCQLYRDFFQVHLAASDTPSVASHPHLKLA